MICAQAQWDEENKIDRNLDRILAALDDSKQTAVRQMLAALKHVVTEKPQLNQKINQKLKHMDTTKYSEFMRPLIEKDIGALQNLMR